MTATAISGDCGQEAGVGAVGRPSQANTVIVSRAGDPDRNASVWVRASYTGYRIAYIGFLNHVYGMEATTATLAGYDVDHLLNRARSPGGAGYIRIEAVNSAVNQAWGRLFPDARHERPRGARRVDAALRLRHSLAHRRSVMEGLGAQTALVPRPRSSDRR